MRLGIERLNSAVVNLEIPVALQRDGWRCSQSQYTPANQWQAYLNYLCLSVSLPWLADSFNGQVQTWDLNREAASFWELVEGSIVTVGECRICLLPHTSFDRDEFRVPREWVEIPSWVADYYLAVQIDLDDESMTIWGYATHQQIQQHGFYDDLDRMYCLDGDKLIQDLSILQLTEEMSLARPGVPRLAPLEPVSPSQAHNYLTAWNSDRLSVPRLEIDEDEFPQWLALLSNDNWRQQLTDRRLDLATPFAIKE